jgi:hypothetical protein
MLTIRSGFRTIPDVFFMMRQFSIAPRFTLSDCPRFTDPREISLPWRMGISAAALLGVRLLRMPALLLAAAALVGACWVAHGLRRARLDAQARVAAEPTRAPGPFGPTLADEPLLPTAQSSLMALVSRDPLSWERLSRSRRRDFQLWQHAAERFDLQLQEMSRTGSSLDARQWQRVFHSTFTRYPGILEKLAALPSPDERSGLRHWLGFWSRHVGDLNARLCIEGGPSAGLLDLCRRARRGMPIALAEARQWPAAGLDFAKALMIGGPDLFRSLLRTILQTVQLGDPQQPMDLRVLARAAFAALQHARELEQQDAPWQPASALPLLAPLMEQDEELTHELEQWLLSLWRDPQELQGGPWSPQFLLQRECLPAVLLNRASLLGLFVERYPQLLELLPMEQPADRALALEVLAQVQARRRCDPSWTIPPCLWRFPEVALPWCREDPSLLQALHAEARWALPTIASLLSADSSGWVHLPVTLRYHPFVLRALWPQLASQNSLEALPLLPRDRTLQALEEEGRSLDLPAPTDHFAPREFVDLADRLRRCLGESFRHHLADSARLGRLSPQDAEAAAAHWMVFESGEAPSMSEGAQELAPLLNWLTIPRIAGSVGELLQNQPELQRIAAAILRAAARPAPSLPTWTASETVTLLRELLIAI